MPNPSEALGPLGTILNELRTDTNLNIRDIDDLKIAVKLIQDQLKLTPPAPPPTVPGPLPPPPITPPPPSTGEMYLRTVVPQANASWALIDRDDTVIDLSGASYPNLVVEIAAGVHHVGVRNGTLRAIRGRRLSDDTSDISGLNLSDLNIRNGQGTAILTHGDGLFMRNVTATARDYCLYHGGTITTIDAQLYNCDFTSEGPESTARFTGVSNLLVAFSRLRNGNKHALRVHGTCSIIHIDDVQLSGAGNGLCIGAMGPQVPASVDRVLLDDVRIDVSGPDRLNLARDGSVRDLRIRDSYVRSPANWNLVTEYMTNHPTSWDVSGLREIV